MNLLRFLKSTKGAIKPLNALLVSGVAGVGFFFVVSSATDKHLERMSQVRSVSSIQSSGATSQRGYRPGGSKSAMNFTESSGDFVDEKTRAEMGGNTAYDRYKRNESGLRNTQNYLNGLDDDHGQAAQFSGSEGGLGMNTRELLPGQNRYAVGGSDVRVPGNTGAYRPYGEGDAAGSSAGQTEFTKASMAHSSGHAFGGASGPISSGAAGGAGSGIGNGAAGGEGRRLSGAMPRGSAAQVVGLDGALAQGGKVDFDRSRNAHGTGARLTGSGEGELNDVLRKSAAAASNKYASANEGARAFFGAEKSSGGVTVDGGSELGSGTSADLTAPTAKKLKAIGNRMKSEENKQEERQRANRNLIIQLVATAVGSLGMMYAGAKILSKMDLQIKILDYAIASLSGFPFASAAVEALQARRASLHMNRWLIAAGMMAAVAGASAWLMVNASKFIHNYGSDGGTGIAIASLVVAPILTAGMVFVALKPDLVNGFLEKNWGAMKKVGWEITRGPLSQSIVGRFGSWLGLNK